MSNTIVLSCFRCETSFSHPNVEYKITRRCGVLFCDKCVNTLVQCPHCKQQTVTAAVSSTDSVLQKKCLSPQCGWEETGLNTLPCYLCAHTVSTGVLYQGRMFCEKCYHNNCPNCLQTLQRYNDFKTVHLCETCDPPSKCYTFCE